MSTLSYRIQLTTKGTAGGPYYNVTYTTGSTFYPVLAGTPAYLPTTSSTAVVTIPSGSFNYLAFNLDSGVDPCGLCDYDYTFIITGSEPPPPPPTSSCCTPTITSTALSGSSTSSLFVNYSVTSGEYCLTCSFVTLQTSSNGGASWGGDVTGSCVGSQFTIVAPLCDTTGSYRIQQTCSGSVTSSYSATASFSFSCSTSSYYTYRIYNPSFGYSSPVTACSNQSFDGWTDYYAAESTLATVTRFYVDATLPLTTPFVGGNQWYAFTAEGTSSPVQVAQISNGGFLSNSSPC
jgi:hypothetical protein